MRSPVCNFCNDGKAVVHCMIHSATFCLQCDYKIHLSDHVMTMDNHNQSRFLLCSNCVSETGDVQCLGEGIYLCKTCVSNANVVSRFPLCNNSSSRNNNTFNNTSPTSPLDIFDLDSSSCSSSLIDPKKSGFSFVTLPFNNGDSSSAFGFSQNFDNYTKSYSDHSMLMPPPPDILDIPKESYCSGFDGYDTKEDVDNVWLNNFDGDLKEYFPAEELILTDQMNINEITEHNAETTTKVISPTSTCMSSVTHKDYSMEALANASCQDYDNIQMIGSKAKEETDMNNLGLFPNTLAQLDCGPPHLILTDEMLSWDDQTLASNHVYTPRSRKEAVTRYLVKKKKRKFGKQIRYQSRKSTADTKRRFKGRFTKAGAKYDYDPAGANNDYNESVKTPIPRFQSE